MRGRFAALALPCLALGAIALGRALQILDGFYHPIALNWALAAFGLAAAGTLMLPAVPSTLRWSRPTVVTILALGIAWQVAMLFGSPPGRAVSPSADLSLFRSGIALEGALIAAAFLRHTRIRRLWFPALLAVHALVGVWMVRAAPDPGIDVVVVHREAINALLADEDPYRISFENIYGGDSGVYYNPRAIVGNRVAFGYPYPPLSLFLAVPGQIIANDYRYAELAALLLAAALVGYVRPSLHSKLAAALLLTTPRGFFVLEQGWTEPIGLLMTALVVFFMVRRPAVVPWVGGLLAVTKQYYLLAGPLLLKYAWSRGWRGVPAFVVIATLAGAAVTLPLALWHPNRFLEAVILLQTREPFRPDSLSLLSWASREGWGSGTFLWALGAAGITMLVALWRVPSTAAGFAASLALSLMAMFMFGSKAFCNYYFLVIGTLCCAIAAQQDPQTGLTAAPFGRTIRGEENTNARTSPL